MNQQETEQFAALRMHVAHMHNALKALIGELVGVPLTVAGQQAVDAATAVLEISEPELRAMVLAIGEDGSVLSKLQSEALKAAISGVRAHHEDVRKARADGDAALAHATAQLQSQGQALYACRAELQSKADALAQVTARLGKIEQRAFALVRHVAEAEPGQVSAQAADLALELGEALK